MVLSKKDLQEMCAELPSYKEQVIKEFGHRVFARKNAPRNAVYIGRGSQFGNPFKMADKSDAERDRVCNEYRKWLAGQLKVDAALAKAVRGLKGRVVACYCSNGTNSEADGAKWCHGHILLSACEYLHDLDDCAK